MVDVTPKPEVYREATAVGRIKLRKETVARIRESSVEKGDVLEAARIAGVLAAKNTPSMIPLCHPIPITHVDISFELGDSWVDVRATVRALAKTGVEMEALAAASAALLTIWDMVKQYEKDEEGQYPHTSIESIYVLSKVKELTTPSIQHRAEAPKLGSFAIVTCSTSRYEKLVEAGEVRDESGELARALLERSGYRVVSQEVVPDDEEMIKNIVAELLNDPRVDAVITIGGTGLSPKDVTIEAVKSLVDREVPGFGEIFRLMSFQRIGSAAALSRAFAGVCGKKLIFCIPGSPQAVETALSGLVIPEFSHMIKHVRES